MVRGWRKVAYGVQLLALGTLAATAGSGSAKPASPQASVVSVEKSPAAPSPLAPTLDAEATPAQPTNPSDPAAPVVATSPAAPTFQTDQTDNADIFAAPFSVDTAVVQPGAEGLADAQASDPLSILAPAPAQVSAQVSDQVSDQVSGSGITPPGSAKSSSSVTGSTTKRKPSKKVVDPAVSVTGKATIMVYGDALGNGWEDMGWSSSRELGAGPAKIEMGDLGGWILGHPSESIHAATLEFSYRTERNLGAFLFITVANSLDDSLDVLVPASKAKPGDWINVRIPVAKLNARSLIWDRVRFRPSRAVPRPTLVSFRNIRFTGAVPVVQVAKRKVVAPILVPAPAGATPTTPTTLPIPEPSLAPAPSIALKPETPVATKAAAVAPSLPKASKVAGGVKAMSINCQDAKHKISPYIYGIGYSGAGYLTAKPWNMGASINRWGGNPTSRYNFELGNVWSSASDYYFRNGEITTGNAFEAFAANNAAAGMANAVTLPTLGWVAKDSTSFSFPVSVYGKQQDVNGDAGNGKSPAGKDLESPDPKTTSVATTPESVAGWVSKIKGRTAMYFLDNEPELWFGTHRDVHPKPAGYDEILDKTLKYGAAVRKADPNAVIAGPSSFGSWAYFFSGIDGAEGLGNAPDRRAHGNVPFLEWYLRNVRGEEQKTGKKILDVLDVHFYPQAEGMYGWGEKTDPEHAALRIRQTRGMWDSTYKDESWIGDQTYGKLALIPRMQKIIADNAPGLGFSVGEWNFGAEGHISGALATAEVLGRFGQGGVYSAFYWTAPPENSPTFWAFRAFRNFDGAGGKFLNNSVGTTMAEDMSLFASTNDDGTQMTAMILNLDPKNATNAQISLSNCRGVKSATAFTYTGEPNGFAQAKPSTSAANLEIGVAPYSITVVRANLG